MQHNNFKETEIGLIPEDWDLLTIGESMEKIIDYRGKTPKKKDKGIPLITAKIVKNGRIKEPTEFIAEEDYDEWMRRGMPKAGDILVTTEAPLGEVAQLDNRKVALAQRLITLRGKKGLVDNNFLKFILQSSFVQYGIESRGTGTTVIGIRQKELKKVLLPIPPLEEQLKIAHILLSIDKKIYLNHQMNQTLEKIGQSIFQHWFVHYEFPNSEGQPYKSSGGEMVDSELGKIPKGWEFGKFGNIVDNFDKKRVPLSKKQREPRKGQYPYYGATSIMDYIDNFLFDGTYVLMAEDGSVIDDNEKPVLQYVWGKFWVNNHAHVLKGKDGIPDEFIYLLLKNTNIRHLVTGAVQLKINQKNMNSLEVVVPDSDILSKFSEIIKPIFAKYRASTDENKILTHISNSLLPKLMSGKIRVNINEEVTAK